MSRLKQYRITGATRPLTAWLPSLAALGAFAGLGVGALIGAVLPNRAHATGRDPFLHVQPMVIGRERGVRATLLF